MDGKTEGSLEKACEGGLLGGNLESNKARWGMGSTLNLFAQCNYSGLIMFLAPSRFDSKAEQPT